MINIPTIAGDHLTFFAVIFAIIIYALIKGLEIYYKSNDRERLDEIVSDIKELSENLKENSSFLEKHTEALNKNTKLTLAARDSILFISAELDKKTNSETQKEVFKRFSEASKDDLFLHSGGKK